MESQQTDPGARFFFSTTLTESCIPSCLSDAGVDDLTAAQLGLGAGEGQVFGYPVTRSGDPGVISLATYTVAARTLAFDLQSCTAAARVA